MSTKTLNLMQELISKFADEINESEALQLINFIQKKYLNPQTALSQEKNLDSVIEKTNKSTNSKKYSPAQTAKIIEELRGNPPFKKITQEEIDEHCWY